MNATIENFARQQIIEQLSILPEDWQRNFKLMYGRNKGKRSVEDAVAMSIPDIVAEVPAERLDWALQQVENSHAKREKVAH